MIELITSKDNPLCISPFIVHYTINKGLVWSVEYTYHCRLYKFIERKLCIKDGIVKHKGVVIKSNPLLKKLPTSLQEPLLIRQSCIKDSSFTYVLFRCTVHYSTRDLLCIYTLGTKHDTEPRNMAQHRTVSHHATSHFSVLHHKKQGRGPTILHTTTYNR